jgi:hypothetical protein
MPEPRAQRAEEILASIPLSDDWTALEAWFAEGRQKLSRLTWDSRLEATLQAVEVGAHVRETGSVFGHHPNPDWRRLVLATFLADWACYPAPVDQASFERLLYVMHVFPAGFRLWWVKSEQLGWLPVGYSAWHPISAETFETLAEKAATLRDRSIIPLPALKPEGNFLYLFNYSIVSALRGTSCSKQLVRRFAEDVHGVAYQGLVAITVSVEGVRVAERFGMKRSGTLVVSGSEEWVYTARR